MNGTMNVKVRYSTMIVTTVDVWTFEQHLALSKLEDRSHSTAHVQRDKKLYAEMLLLGQYNRIFGNILKVYITWKQPQFRKDMHFIGKYPQEV